MPTYKKKVSNHRYHRSSVEHLQEKDERNIEQQTLDLGTLEDKVCVPSEEEAKEIPIVFISKSSISTNSYEKNSREEMPGQLLQTDLNREIIIDLHKNSSRNPQQAREKKLSVVTSTPMDGFGDEEEADDTMK